jgi:hypothetical protein
MKAAMVVPVIVVCLCVVALAAVAPPKAPSPGGDALLLDVRLVRKTFVDIQGAPAADAKPLATQTVAQVRMLSATGRPTSVFLPSGTKGGVALAFAPMLRKMQGGMRVLIDSADASYRFSPSEEFDPPGLDAAVLTPALDGVTGQALLGEDIQLFKAGLGNGAVCVQYEVWVRCERLVPRAELVHEDATVFEVGGEPLHDISCAVPALMSVGVKVEPPKRVAATK